MSNMSNVSKSLVSRESSLGHAEQLLFSCVGSKVTTNIAENCNAFFFDSLSTLSGEIRVHRAGSQLKNSLHPPGPTMTIGSEARRHNQ